LRFTAKKGDHVSGSGGRGKRKARLAWGGEIGVGCRTDLRNLGRESRHTEGVNGGRK